MFREFNALKTIKQNNNYEEIYSRFQNRGTHGRHILQDAIQLQDYTMVDMLVEAGADVNIRVHVKEYFLVCDYERSEMFTDCMSDCSYILFVFCIVSERTQQHSCLPTDKSV